MDTHPSQKIAFFGGTFDPIHYGHLSLALDLLEKHGLDEVWFCPTSHNPLKRDPCIAPIEERMEMVQLAVEPFPQFRVLDIEAQEQVAAYTVDSLRLLHEQLPESAELFLILGEDATTQFSVYRAS